MTSFEYKTEHAKLQSKLKNLELDAKKRLINIIKTNPNVAVTTINNNPIYARNLSTSDFLSSLSFDNVITYMNNMETEISNQTKQLSLFN